MHVAIWEQEEIPVHSKRQAQIKAQVAKVSAEYSDYSNVFSAEHAMELSENIGISEHAIKLEDGKT